MKKIRFNQPKYIIAFIAYIGLLTIGAFVYWIADTDIKDATDSNLKTTEYLNSDLPEANLKSDLGSKRSNVQNMFGGITDLTAIDNIENDIDSVRKKEDYSSQYSEEDKQKLEELQAEKDNEKKQKTPSGSNSSSKKEKMGDDDYILPSTAGKSSAGDDEIFNELEKVISTTRNSGRNRYPTAAVEEESISVTDSLRQLANQVKTVAEYEAKTSEVTKKKSDTNAYFHTISDTNEDSENITAIVDEEITVVDGSRVRLRLLDDIEIDGITIKKGSYLYAIMSGFSKQRIKGTISSVMLNSKIFNINLSIYDTDGLEGLYVPESTFRETAQEVAGSIAQQNMNMNNGGYNNNSVTQWAMQGLQNAYQKTSSAISKAIRKNKVNIKYGTKVYLINSKNRGKTRN